MFRDVPGCSGMFRNVPECSGMFRNVPCSEFYRRPLRNGRRKAFYFCRLRPADEIVSVLFSNDDIFLTEGCREKHLALIIRDKIRLA